MSRQHARDPVREAFWRQAIQQFHEQQADNKLSIRTFCQQQQLSEASFYAWRRELRLRDSEQTFPTDKQSSAPNKRPASTDKPSKSILPAFVPLVLSNEPIASTAASDSIIFELGQNCTLKLPVRTPTVQLIELVRVLITHSSTTEVRT